jgi:hypothetical protein
MEPGRQRGRRIDRDIHQMRRQPFMARILMSEDFRDLLAAYRSGQVSEAQWQKHLTAPLFALWLARRQERHNA